MSVVKILSNDKEHLGEEQENSDTIELMIFAKF